MMEKPAVVEESDDSEKSGTTENCDRLLLHRAVLRQQDRSRESQIDCNSAE